MANWKKMYRNLEKGDIIRTKVSNPHNPKYGEYVYAVATGEGFGSRTDTIGNAIFVIHQSYDLEKVLENRNVETKDWDRWERFWGIDIMEG